MKSRPRLLFVSTRFLFPADSGGRIRTKEVLRNLKGGRFEVVLASPASEAQINGFAVELASVADRIVHWRPQAPGRVGHLLRMRHLFSTLPIPVATDVSAEGRRAIARELESQPADVAVFDFPHSVVLAPDELDCATVLFTHNVEAEIFARHAAIARDALRRWIWRDQHRKMARFERDTLGRFDRVVAVSERDRAAFLSDYAVGNVSVIPTGVDLEYFEYREPQASGRVVFTGSMDWLANVDGVEFFMDEVWPRVALRVPEATMTVVGRAPPAALVERTRTRRIAWNFTGRVEDIRPEVQGAAVCVIPLRVGGGTRIKAFEAMAMGVPVVSTAIGIEGLGVEPDRHFLLADDAADFADAVVRLLKEPELGRELAQRARRHLESGFSNAVVARRFEEICTAAMTDRQAYPASAALA